MLRPIFFITVAFGVVVSAPNVRAGLCFQYTQSGGGISVAQVDIPAPNKCVTFALYEQVINAPFTLEGAGTGSLCTSTDSPMVIFNYTYDACRPLGSNNYFESGTCRLQLDHNGNLPTQSSVCRGAVITGKPGQLGKAGNFFNQDDLVITKCDSNSLEFRVPGGLLSECGTGRLRLQNENYDQPTQGLEQQSQSPEQPSRGAEQPRQSP